MPILGVPGSSVLWLGRLSSRLSVLKSHFALLWQALTKGSIGEALVGVGAGRKVSHLNEVAGIRLPDIAAPLGTFTGWNIRGEGFAEGALMVVGSFIPFAATTAARNAAGDPRLSLEERYPTHAHYVDAVARAAAELEGKRLLLAEDVQRYIAAAKAAAVGA